MTLMAISASAQQTDTTTSNVPNWLGEVVWYQIFVERFRNGDTTNDPTLADIDGAWPHLKPTGWNTTPWGHDWYEQEDWAAASGSGFYQTVQMRRYGGDLQGVIDKLDYLHDLGVTAIYLNPINDSPSLHKYDARNYRHVDRNFGPDSVGDAQIMAAEDPVDPATWQWTAADRLFLTLIEEVHKRGIRVIVDYSFNHTGITFWAWRDVVNNQADSRFADWYDIQRFDDPDTPANEFAYRGWAGVRTLPELRKYPVDGAAEDDKEARDLHPDAKRHVFAVTRRWLDPNGDGDCSDGVDGFRLDVAEHIPMAFWRDYQHFVSRINPQAALIAELWWEKWPDKMRDPAPWIQQGLFHSVMNYRWYAPTRSFFTDAPPEYSPASYAQQLMRIQGDIPPVNVSAMMNVAASHDTPRLATSLYNPTKYKYRVGRRGNPEYKVNRSSAETLARQKLLLLQQFTWVGAPHIYYGDEVGMWGADDPDCRKPMLWPDIEYQPERHLPDGSLREPDDVAANYQLRDFYRMLIALRKRFLHVIARGETTFINSRHDTPLLVYRKTNGDDHLIVALNRDDQERSVRLDSMDHDGYRDLLDDASRFVARDGRISVNVRPLQARLLVLDDKSH